MCLAIPGKIESIVDGDDLSKKAIVNFGGVLKEVSLACVPEANVGDYAIVHAGFAITLVNQQEADEMIACFEKTDNTNYIK